MAHRFVNIAIVDNRREHAERRRRLIQNKPDWPAQVETEIFENADDLIDTVEEEGRFFDVIISDVFMPERDEDPSEEGTPESGGIRIKNWLQRKREENSDYQSVQLRWISKHSDVSPFIDEHIGPHTGNYHWLRYKTHHDKRSFKSDFIPWVVEAIEMSNPGLLDLDLPAHLLKMSDAIINVHQEAAKVAEGNQSVLITGEAGTGMEEIARYIHDQSGRTGLFISVDCRRTAKELESRLLGERTEAETRIGRLQQADGGTLFLDKIDQLSSVIQDRLAHFLKSNGEFNRVAGTRTLQGDVRIIAATRGELNAEKEQGQFREDLYHLLSGINLTVPPLRERPEDIPVLTDHFLKKLARENDLGLPTISPAAEDALKGYTWPGNDWELLNEIQGAVGRRGRLNGRIEINDLSSSLFEEGTSLPVEPLSAHERRVYEALLTTGFNLEKAGDLLGITRQGVRRFIYRKSSDGSPLRPLFIRLYERGKEASKSQKPAQEVSSQENQLPPLEDW